MHRDGKNLFIFSLCLSLPALIYCRYTVGKNGGGDIFHQHTPEKNFKNDAVATLLISW